MSKNHKNIINYDKEADVLALYINKGLEEEFVEISPNISVELNKKGEVIGIEIINASKVLKPVLKSLGRRQTIYAQ